MVLILDAESADHCGPAFVAFTSPQKSKRSSAPDVPPPEYTPGSAFDTCISEPSPGIGLDSGLDAINTLVSQLSDVESLTVLSPRTISGAFPALDVPGEGGEGDASASPVRTSSQAKCSATLQDYSKRLKPIRTSSSWMMATSSSVSADPNALSHTGQHRTSRYRRSTMRPSSADLFTGPKLASAPLLSELQDGTMMSDDDADLAADVLRPTASPVPTLTSRDSLGRPFRPVSSQSNASHGMRGTPSCSFIVPVPGGREERSFGQDHQRSPVMPLNSCARAQASSSGRLSSVAQQSPERATTLEAEESIEGLILRMGAAVGTMSTRTGGYDDTVMPGLQDVKQHQQALLLNCVEAIESFLQPVPACGPIDSEMSMMQPEITPLGSRMHSRQSSIQGGSPRGGPGSTSMATSGALPAAMSKSCNMRPPLDGSKMGNSFTNHSGLLAHQSAAQRRMLSASFAPAYTLPQHVTPGEMGMRSPADPPGLTPVRVHTPGSTLPTTRPPHGNMQRSNSGVRPTSHSSMEHAASGSAFAGGGRPVSRSLSPEHVSPRAVRTPRSKRPGKRADAKRKKKQKNAKGDGATSVAAGAGGTCRGPAVLESSSGSAKGESVEHTSTSLWAAGSSAAGGSGRRMAGTRQRFAQQSSRAGSAKGESVERSSGSKPSAGGNLRGDSEQRAPQASMLSSAVGTGGAGGSSNADGTGGKGRAEGGLKEGKRSASGRSGAGTSKVLPGGGSGRRGSGRGDGDGVPSHPHVPAAGEIERGDHDVAAGGGDDDEEAAAQGCFANFWGTNRKQEKKARAPQAPKILAPEIPKEKGQGCGIQCGCW